MKRARRCTRSERANDPHAPRKPHAASVWACRRVGSEAASRCARLLAAAEADCCSERRGLSVSGPHPEQSAVLHVTLMRADGLIVEECGGSHSGGACGRMHVEPKATRCGAAGGCSTWLRCRAAAHHWQCRLPTSRAARAMRAARGESGWVVQEWTQV